MKPLWDHQAKGIELARQAIRDGHSRIVIQIPTGGGKSRCGAEIAISSNARAKRVLWLAQRTELISQAFDTLAEHGVDVGAIAASCDRPARPDSPTQVASIQTLLAREHRPPADVIIWDECQHASEGAPQWASLLEAYPNAIIIGLTATPERSDGKGLAPLFTHLIQVCSVRDITSMVPGDGKPLVPCRVIRPDAYLKKRGVHGNVLAQDPVDAYFEHARGEQGFLFCRSVEEAEAYTARINARGVVARVVDAGTPKRIRDAVISGFRAGTVRVLCNVYVFTEGTDLPAATVCILASGCGTAGGYLQRVGRVLRSAPGKTEALLIDLPGVSWLFGMPEDDRVWKLEGKACVISSRKCPVCGTPVEEFPCTVCQYEPEPDDGVDGSATEIANVPLSPYARELVKGPVQRAETAIRWAHAARINGKRPGWVWHRYQEVYGERMPNKVWAEVKSVIGAGAL